MSPSGFIPKGLFLSPTTNKHGARGAVTSLLAWLVQECFCFLLRIEDSIIILLYSRRISGTNSLGASPFQKHSARGGLQRMYYYRNLLRFLCRVSETSKSTWEAVWAKRVLRMITIILHPASEHRTFLCSFFCFGFLSGDRKKMKIGTMFARIIAKLKI